MVLKYRKDIDKLNLKKKQIRAKAEAECELIQQQIDLVSKREQGRIVLIRQRWSRQRARELGVKPIKNEEIHAR